jgi:diacylglycerol kinase family enzyme
LAHTRYQRAALIFNPVAGRGFYQPEKPVEKIAAALRRHVPDVLLLPTTLEHRAASQARRALGEGCDLICPLGGDGTINEALQAVAGSQAVLFPIAGGTANVFARETGMGLDAVKTAVSLQTLEERVVPLGVVEFPAENRRRLFLLMCGAGIDANAVYDVDSSLKQQVGIFAYVWSGLKQLMHPLAAITATLGEEKWTGGLIVISKSRLYGGGLVLTPGAHLLADRFDIVCFRSVSPLEYPGYLAAVVTRTMDKIKGVTHRQFAQVEVVAAEHSAGVYVQVDGELAGSLPIRVRLGPETVKVLAPGRYWARREGNG